MELENQTALVAGGTAGIGLASARLLALEGAAVIITGRDPLRGKQAAADIEGNVVFIPADLPDLESVKWHAREAGDIDILDNNAASCPSALTADQDVTSFEGMFDTNVRGAYFLVAQLVPGMLDRGRGRIINVTSMMASKGVPAASGYSIASRRSSPATASWRRWSSRVTEGGVGKSGRKFLPSGMVRLQRCAMATELARASGWSAKAAAISACVLKYCSDVKVLGRILTNSARNVKRLFPVQ